MEHQSKGLGPLFDTRLRIEDLAEHLREASASRKRPETLVNLGCEIVLPLLDRLGWDVEDKSVVKPGLRLTTGVIDFALCVPPETRRYLSRSGACRGTRTRRPQAHLTTALSPRCSWPYRRTPRIWRLHFPAGRGKTRSREFARFELVPESAEGMAQAFDRFLACHSVESGEAWREGGTGVRQKRLSRKPTGRGVILSKGRRSYSGSSAK